MFIQRIKQNFSLRDIYLKQQKAPRFSRREGLFNAFGKYLAVGLFAYISIGFAVASSIVYIKADSFVLFHPMTLICPLFWDWVLEWPVVLFYTLTGKSTIG